MLDKLSYQNKVYIYFSFFIILLLFSAAIIFYMAISGIIIDNVEKAMVQNVEKTSSNLDSIIKQLDMASTQVIYSKELQDVMYSALSYKDKVTNYFDINYDEKESCLDILVSISSPKYTLKRVGIFNNENIYISAGLSGETQGEFPKNIVKLNYKAETAILPPHKDSWVSEQKAQLVISLFREMIGTYSSSQHLGYIEVQQPYSEFEDICKQDDNSNKQIVVIDDMNRIVYPIGKYDNSELSYFCFLKNYTGKTSRRPWDNKEVLVYRKLSEYSGWTTIIIQPKTDFMTSVYFLQYIFITVGILFLAASLVILFVITKRLTKPIKEMRQLVKNLTLENLSINISDKTNNEVYLLNLAFNKTLSQLRKAMEQTVEAKAGEAQAHMLALQAQMNPHFLYNTLMCISGSAWKDGSMRTFNMCNQLSEMLRYIGSFEEKDITLRDELTYTENFLELYKYRYEDSLTYRIEVDENMKNIIVPKLIIKPLVENSFIHGFRAVRPPYTIQIKGSMSENNWIIEITDNGCGFDEEVIKDTFEKLGQYRSEIETGSAMNKLTIGGMGLKNIFLRLLLMYKIDTVFEIKNNHGGGSTVILGGSIT